jgi:tRNA nucleotidyltransferase (CCA-adding enzyme)
VDVIVSHLNADFDALASMVAAKKIYPEAEMVFPGSQEKKVRDFLADFEPPDIKKVKDIDLPSISRLIIVDAIMPDRIGPFSGILDKPGLKIHIYDHHTKQKGAIRGQLEKIEQVGATATIFAEILKAKKLSLTPMEATILALGIYEETGGLLYPSTTERDIHALAFLLKRGASLKIVSKYIRTELSREEIDLLNELIQTSRELFIHGVRVRVAKASREDYFGDAAHLAHRMMDMEDIEAVVLMLRMEDKIVMIGRSRAPELDISKIMEEFGGGGHPAASSATVKEMPLELLEEKVIEALNRSVKPGKTARDVMTKPVITISAEDSVKEAETMMTKYGVNVLPVVKKEKYTGIISREAVEKALFHGFGKSKVIDFATTDVITVEEDTPVMDVEGVMIERNQRFLPVLKGGSIIGAITRTDILRVIYEDYLRKSRVGEAELEKAPSMHKNLAPLLKEKFPKDIYELLKTAGEAAQRLDCDAYMVGGSVRDLIRGEENLDIDLVIEGDAIAFSKELAVILDARARTHERFGTAKIITKTLKLDVATARTEYYESPAALPTVETSSIKKDLYRRDFTINTLAIKLNPSDFGLLVDFFGGQRDLRGKTIRALHNLSFIEDPTRAFRAVRFAERFGFKLSKHTESLIKTTLKMNLFDRLSGSRLYDEMLLMFSETEPVKAIKKLSGYGLLSVIHPNLVFTDALDAILNAVNETLLWFNLSFMGERPEKGVIFTMGLLSTLKDEEGEQALARLSVNPKEKEKILRGISNAKELLRALPIGETASIYDALSPINLETLLFAMSLTDDKNKKKEISHYLLELRRVKPLLTGEDIKRMGIEPGPVYSKVLKEVLRERLRGKLKSREDEEKFVREYFGIAY